MSVLHLLPWFQKTWWTNDGNLEKQQGIKNVSFSQRNSIWKPILVSIWNTFHGFLLLFWVVLVVFNIKGIGLFSWALATQVYLNKCNFVLPRVLFAIVGVTGAHCGRLISPQTFLEKNQLRRCGATVSMYLHGKSFSGKQDVTTSPVFINTKVLWD